MLRYGIELCRQVTAALCDSLAHTRRASFERGRTLRTSYVRVGHSSCAVERVMGLSSGNQATTDESSVTTCASE